MSDYDIAIIGAGPGGYVAAVRASQYGAKVALIERSELGGTCLNRGCIPSKALLESIHVLKMIRSAADYGISCEPPSFDLGGIYGRKDKVVENLRKGIAALMKKNGVTVINGEGCLKDANTVSVKGEAESEITADKIILAAGTKPLRPRFFPMDAENVVDSDYFLTLEKLPRSVCLIGGGYIGCEMATILNGLGVEVTVVEMMQNLLPLSDEDISKEMRKVFKKAKMGLHLGVKVESVEVLEPGKVKVLLDNGKEVEAEKVLVSIGRERCTDGLGLENAGISLSERGAVLVNENCQTSCANIYAIGDLTDKAQLAHVASKMGLIAAAHACDKEAKANFEVIPSCVFTQPEIGQVGISEAQAVEKGLKVKSSRFSFQALGKAHAMGETAGFFKIVAEEESGKILGVHIIGPHASDIIGEAAVAMEAGFTVEQLAHTIHAHPTLHEGLMECAESWTGLGIHG
ncbi:MAG: dihydrolipoyl dehydrogenase [Planctomycetes bacterium]|nr:dihydrolipoyl dehydrogenase [Planctomycetota bacterium]